MNIAQLLHKLQIISNVEIVVPLLPEIVCCKQATAMITAECDEMALATVVNIPTQAKTGLEWATCPQKRLSLPEVSGYAERS